MTKLAQNLNVTTTVNGTILTRGANKMIKAENTAVKFAKQQMKAVREVASEADRAATEMVEVLAATENITIPHYVTFAFDGTEVYPRLHGCVATVAKATRLYKELMATLCSKLTAAQIEELKMLSTELNGEFSTELQLTEGFIKTSKKELLRKEDVSILGFCLDMPEIKNAIEVPKAHVRFVEDKISESRLTRSNLLNIQELTFPVGSSFYTAEKATDMFIHVTFEGDGSDDIRPYTILMVEQVGGLTNISRVETVRGQERYINVVTGAMTTELPEAKRYKLVGATAAGQRGGAAFYVNETNYTEAQINEAMNLSTVGAWAKMVGQEVTSGEANNFNVRTYATFTGNVEAGAVGTYAIVCNYLGTSDDNESPVDGHLAISFDMAVKMLKVLTGKDNVDARAALKLAVQCRPYTTKCFAEAYTNESMDELVLSAAGGDVNNIIRVRREDVTPEFEAALDLCFSKKKVDGKAIRKTSPLWGKVVIIGDGTTPDILSDMNGYKAPFDYAQVDQMNVLETPNDTKPHGSIQLFEKALIHNQDATIELIRELGQEFIETEVLAMFNKVQKVPTIKEASNPYYTGLINSICPAFTLADRKMFERGLNTIKARCEAVFNKFKFDFEGVNARISSDYAALFGLRLLAFDEVVVSDAVYRKLVSAKCGYKAIGIKYPSMGVKELLLGNVLSAAQVVERIESRDDIADSVKASLISKYSNLNDGVAVICALQEAKDKLAGLDFDFDMICFFFDARLVELFSNMPEEIISIDTTNAEKVPMKFKDLAKSPKAPVVKAHKSSAIAAAVAKASKANAAEQMFVTYGDVELFESLNNDTFAFSYKTAGNPIIKYANISNKVNIGSVTHANESGVFAMCDIDVMKAMMFATFKEEGTNKYTGLKAIPVADGVKYNVSYAEINRIKDEMEKASWTKENLINIFEDLNRVYRLYQELGIDAAKTFMAPALVLQVAKGFKAAVLKQVTFDKPEVEVNFKDFASFKALVAKLEEEGEKVPTMVFNDPLNMVRTELFKSAQEQIAEIVLDEFQDPIEALEYWANKLAGQGMTLDALMSVTDMYGKIAMHYRTATMGLKVDSPIRAALVGNRKELYDGLRNMFIAATPGLTDQQRGSLARVLSHYKLTKKNGEFSFAAKVDFETEAVMVSSFGDTVLGYEYFINVLKRQDALQVAGQRIEQGFVVPGKTVTFENGSYVGEYGTALVSGDLTGEYTIEEVDGALYATQRLTDIIKRPQASNTVTLSIAIPQTCDTENYVLAANELLTRERLNKTVKFNSNGYAFEVEGIEEMFKTGANGSLKHMLMHKEGTIKNVIALYNEEDRAYGLYVTVELADAKFVETESQDVVPAKAKAKSFAGMSKEDLLALLKSPATTEASSDLAPKKKAGATPLAGLAKTKTVDAENEAPVRKGNMDALLDAAAKAKKTTAKKVGMNVSTFELK